MYGGNFTTKAQEAIMSAQNIARSKEQQQIDAVHLLNALLSQEESVVLSLFDKIGVDIDNLKKKTNEALARIPVGSSPKTFGQFYLTQDMARVLDRAREESVKMGDEFISVEHLLLGLLIVDTKAKELLIQADFIRFGNVGTSATMETNGLDYSVVLKELAEIRGGQKITDAEPESKFQVIEKYTRNLTVAAKQGKLDPVIGRENEIRRLTQILCRRTKNNPALIGEPGVGKTAIVEGLAQKIVRSDVPESLKNKEIVSLDIGSLVAGTKYRGEFEDRVKALLREITKNKDRYLLFIDELHTLVGAGGAEGAIDASNLLKPALARGELRAIGATTIKEYQKYIERDGALERRFQPIYVSEPSVEDTVLILRGIKDKYELHHGVKIKDSALRKAAELSARYISDRFLPDKAVDLMDESMSYLRLEIESEPADLEELKKETQKLEIEKEALKNEKSKESEKRLRTISRQLAELNEKSRTLGSRWKSEKEIIGNIKRIKNEIDVLKHQSETAGQEANLQKVAEIKYGLIPEKIKELKSSEKKLARIQKNHPVLKEEATEEDIAAVVSKWTGIPVNKLLETEARKLEKMEDIISRRVIGQSKAIQAISDATRRSRAGISEENRPLGSFLFLGPTGVGKTETARALAEFLFNDEASLIRLDMSEYMEKHSVSRMVGSPPGYVGYDEGGQLTDKIRRRPYSVILFDEIEKAHPDIFNILLQVLEDGRLTDSKGRTASFKNAILIMTSNTGSNHIAKMGEFGFSRGDRKIAEKESLKEKIYESLKSEFRPEFLNRIDEIIIFNYLGKEEIKKIVDLEISKVSAVLVKNNNIKLEVTPQAKSFLAEKSYDPNLGARPLKRIIQKEILNPLALTMISGQVKNNEKVVIDVDKDKVVLRTARDLSDNKNKEKALIK
jgi:ATP-dependent Clp protease ATP-binding subunit ClpB